MAYSSDEDAGIDVTLDNCSEISGQSDLKSNHDDADNEIQEKQEEKLLEIIESLSARSTAARAAAFVALRAALQRRAFDAVLFGHRATLADHLARALRRGKDAERKAAAAVAPLVALQEIKQVCKDREAWRLSSRTTSSATQREDYNNIVGTTHTTPSDSKLSRACTMIGDEGTEEFVSEVRPALVATLTDKAASLDARAECCSSLGVLCYVMEDDVTEILEVMRVYETIFSGSYLKGDGSVKVTGAAIEEGVLHAAALDAWALLLAVLEPDHALQLLRTTPPSLQRLAELLEVPALDVRLAAGGALALAHENACSDDGGAEMELAPHVEKLLPRLEELARDSHKYRAKRDRKVQRATFRDILKYFEEGSAPEGSARVGQETAAWRSWGGAAAYGALAAALGGALQPLALRSGRLRAALALPDVMPPDAHALRSHKLTKFERNMNNIAACKARTRARNRNRDKRSAALAM